MPELPEVEITRCGIAAYLTGHSIVHVNVRNRRLRWPIQSELKSLLLGQKIEGVLRRAKYLLFPCTQGTLIMHLGMSGSLRILSEPVPPMKHDHFDLQMEHGVILRFRDPRRFGAILWWAGDVSQHPLLQQLGPEPLSPQFNAKRLYESTRGRRVSIKEAIMDQRMVVGVGNIYANEALFHARMSPLTAAGRISPGRCQRLVAAVQMTLERAIAAGGSSLRDFVDCDGNPGYFQQQYWVYGRAEQSCYQCGASIKKIRQGQRATYYCANCQRT